MIVSELIAQHINFNAKTMKSRIIDKDNVRVTFMLSVPAWINDLDMIKTEDHSIIYAGNKKKGINRHEVTLKNVAEGYPSVSNSKFFTISRNYSVSELTKVDNIKMFMTSEREQVFREIRSNILLEQVGELTKKWNSVSEGKYFKSEKINYGKNKIVSRKWTTLSTNYGGLTYVDTSVSIPNF